MRLRLADPGHEWSSVTLDAHPLSGPCQWAAGWWVRDLGRQPLRRLEYSFRVATRSGQVESVLDPLCPHRIRTDFGLRSVWQRADYRPPAWLDAAVVPGRRTTVVAPSALTGPIPLEVWAPRGLRRSDPAPLLWCHDGPAYDAQAAVVTWAAAHIASGDLPPFRLALAGVRHRMQWYSGSPRYLRSVRLALDFLHTQYAVSAPVAVMGASLGGLTSLLVGLADPRVGAVLAQSGSFFDADLDEVTGGQNRWIDRIVRQVAAIRSGEGASRRPLAIAMTCGRAEQNHANNEAMVAALRRLGHRVHWESVPDLHNYTAWRDSLDPILPNLLHDAWSGPGWARER